MRELGLILNFITSQPGKQAMAIHIVLNITRRKSNQIFETWSAMKFVQLIEYIMRNIFLEKSYTTFGGKIIPRPFTEKLKFSIFLDQ